MSSQFGRVSDGPSGFGNFSSKKYLEGTGDFLRSNSIVAKFAFLILVLILFVMALRLGASPSWLDFYSFTESNSYKRNDGCQANGTHPSRPFEQWSNPNRTFCE
jgi:hypothetical protein